MSVNDGKEEWAAPSMGEDRWQPGHMNTLTARRIKVDAPNRFSEGVIPEAKGKMQGFPTGATRSDDSYKPDPEGFFSPLVLSAYAQYMQDQRHQDDGLTRASDNWQKGIPFYKYMKSLFRHFLDLWKLHRGYTPEPELRHGKLVPVTMEKALSGIMFNTMGYFHEYLMDREAWENRQISEPEDVDYKIRTIKDARKQKVA